MNRFRVVSQFTDSSGFGMSVARLGVWSSAAASARPAQENVNRSGPAADRVAKRRPELVEVDLAVGDHVREQRPQGAMRSAVGSADVRVTGSLPAGQWSENLGVVAVEGIV